MNIKIICEILKGEKPNKIVVIDALSISKIGFRKSKGSQYVFTQGAFLCCPDM